MFKYLCGCRGLATRQGLSSGDKTENMEVRVSSGAVNKINKVRVCSSAVNRKLQEGKTE